MSKQVDFEIETLLSSTSHGGVREQELSSFFKPETVENHHHSWKEWKGQSGSSKKELDHLEKGVWRDWDRKDKKRSSVSSEDDIEEINQVVRGQDIQDAPTQYMVKGIQPHEMPVIGTYVDKRIVTGWQYRVRALGARCQFFGGKALTLQSIGMGYGKRLTFESEKLNENTNYFWSDSQPEGYAFSLEVLHSGDTFHVYDEDERQIGKAYIEAVDQAQNELSCSVDAKGKIIKKVAVTFRCLIQYGADPHGVLPLFSEQEVQLTGVAISQKAKRERKAVLMQLQAALPNSGVCVFYPEED